MPSTVDKRCVLGPGVSVFQPPNKKKKTLALKKKRSNMSSQPSLRVGSALEASGWATLTCYAGFVSVHVRGNFHNMLRWLRVSAAVPLGKTTLDLSRHSAMRRDAACSSHISGARDDHDDVLLAMACARTNARRGLTASLPRKRPRPQVSSRSRIGLAARRVREVMGARRRRDAMRCTKLQLDARVRPNRRGLSHRD